MTSALPHTETIAAISTALGEAAVSVVRVSGDAALAVVKQLTGPALDRLPARLAKVMTLRDATGAVLDRALVLRFAAPASYTGEAVVELHCHGGLLVTQKVLEALLAAGARPAEAGEFTQRAFLNGKMDLTQAEAVMDLIQAQSTLALRAANEQLEGVIGTEASEMRQTLIDVLAHVEAYIDFPDEDISPDVGESLLARIDGAISRCERLLATSEHGRILRQGARTVICGEPNAGKSSLLNLLLGFERAIVSATAGTTRDTIEEVIQVHGVPLRLVDTAGLRESGDALEQSGMERTLREIGRADLIIEVVDGTLPAEKVNRVVLDGDSAERRVLVLNKADLGTHESWTAGVTLSCSARTGVEALRQALAAAVLREGTFSADHPVAINVRHKACFERVRGGLSAARNCLQRNEAPEFTALELREALQALGEVSGRVDIEEVLDAVFSSFCIGK
jgi:tRNA modification GTPase